MSSTVALYPLQQVSSDAQVYSAVQSSSSIVSALKTPPFRTIYLTKDSDPIYFQALKKTLATWKSVLGDRTGISRQQAALGGDDSKIKLTEDLETDREYRNLTVSLLMFVNALSSYQNNSIMMLVDQNRNIQAIAAVAHNTNALYIRYLISAPWNIKMHAPVPEPQQSLKVQRAGSTLMHALYLQAQEKQVAELRLKPLSISYTFYRDALQMQEDAINSEFYYPVQKQVPEQLSVMSAGFEPV